MPMESTTYIWVAYRTAFRQDISCEILPHSKAPVHKTKEGALATRGKSDENEGSKMMHRDETTSTNKTDASGIPFFVMFANNFGR